jgi:DNA-binding NarL/FixJ family response regulator
LPHPSLIFILPQSIVRMPSPDTSNQLFDLASRFVNQTSRHLFLTGKAGTGKTTFLKHIRETSPKKMAVVAPTGVAAINAGGVTMHSFFQLPFGAYIPENRGGWNSTANINMPDTLLTNLRLSRDKRELMQELELLIIDEVSMLRADMLDMVDLILRTVRKQPMMPFGGVQILYIGDLFQLPPVVNNEEWEVLRDYYKSPFFFDAQVIQQSPPVYLELKKIYRQHEADFINLLNNIRNNMATEEDLAILNEHYRPGYQIDDYESYITLTTHNWKADAINRQKLQQLDDRMHEFRAEIEGDFNEKSVPADMVLSLKQGAQIMFIKNDKGEVRRYYNGKIATISRIENDEIYVQFPGENHELQLEKETWRNIRYRYNKEADNIEEEELGTFKQYPIRLAWAITIHKSQGLTFDKAIIDAGASFAPGQVYVALSRLTSLEGLILYSPIHPHCIHTDARVLEFTRSEKEMDLLQQELQQEQKIFLERSLLQTFDWTKFVENFEDHVEDSASLKLTDSEQHVQWAKKLLQATRQQQDFANKFIRQLEQLIPNAAGDGYAFLHQRVKAGAEYFIKAMDEIITEIKNHIELVKQKLRSRKYPALLKELLLTPQRKKQQLQHAIAITEGLMNGVPVSELLEGVDEEKKASQVQEEEVVVAEEKSAKAPKGETRRISLKMFREGMAVADIARQRNLAVSTIEGHLASFIPTGEVAIQELVSQERLAVIMKTLDDMNYYSQAAGPVKEKLGAGYSYGEIRAVLQYRLMLETTQPKEEKEV